MITEIWANRYGCIYQFPASLRHSLAPQHAEFGRLTPPSKLNFDPIQEAV